MHRENAKPKNIADKLVRYLSSNGGQATREKLQKASVLRGSVAEYDAVLDSLIELGVIVCEDNPARKSAWLYRLAQPQAKAASQEVDGGNGGAVKDQELRQSTPSPEQLESPPSAEIATVKPEAQPAQPLASEGFSSQKMLITPEIAREMLAQNKNNRPIRKCNVEAIVAAIKNGHWVMTGNPIAFDKDGRLLDGQHRLMAIIEAGQAVESVVTRGLATDSFLTTDTGAKRGAADVAAMLGFKCYVTTGCAATLLHHYENNSMRIFKKGVTNMEIEKILRDHPGLEVSVSVGKEMGNILPPGIGAFCHYIFSRLDREAADRFFEQLKSGANLKLKSPVLVLRDKLMFYKAGKLMLSRQAIAAIIIKAWNHFRRGKEVSNINWQPREQFPRAI